MRRTLPTLVSLTLAAGLAGCHGGGGTDTPEVAKKVREEALAPRPVTLIQPEVREERPTLELVGELRSDELVVVPAEVSGSVDRVLVDVGDTVTKGDALAWIDRKTWRVRLDQAEADLGAAVADLALAEKELARKKDLLSDRTISQAVFDRVQARYDLAVARVKRARAAHELARRNHDRSVVRAPARGKVAARLVDPGEWADVGSPVVRLSTGERIKVAFRVPERWVRKLAGLERFTFTVAGEDGPRTATLFSVSPVVEGRSRSFEVVGVTPNRDGVLRPGMFATVRLEAPRTIRSLWLPRTAVAAADMPEVMMVEDGRVVVRKVQTGRRQKGMVEIVDGLEPGDLVIEKLAGLTRGIPVKVES